MGAQDMTPLADSGSVTPTRCLGCVLDVVESENTGPLEQTQEVTTPRY